MKLNLEKWAAIVTIIGLPLLLISLGFAYVLDQRTNDQLTELTKVASSENNILLNTMFFNDHTNIAILADIDDGKPILEINGGRFTEEQLDKYLGDFDTVDLAYQEGLLSANELCDSFSYYVTDTMGDAEIKHYLDQNTDYFPGIFDLNKIVASSTNQYCQ